MPVQPQHGRNLVGKLTVRKLHGVTVPLDSILPKQLAAGEKDAARQLRECSLFLRW